ncbi:hypothetical protein D3C76_1253170 [compost metagenome]
MPRPAGRTGTPSWARKKINFTPPTPRRRQQSRRWESRGRMTTRGATSKIRDCLPNPIESMPIPVGPAGTPSWARKKPTYTPPTPRRRQQSRRWGSRVSATTPSAVTKIRDCLPIPSSSMPTPAGRTCTLSWAKKNPTDTPTTPRRRQQPRRWESRIMLTTAGATRKIRDCQPPPT